MHGARQRPRTPRSGLRMLPEKGPVRGDPVDRDEGAVENDIRVRLSGAAHPPGAASAIVRPVARQSRPRTARPSSFLPNPVVSSADVSPLRRCAKTSRACCAGFSFR
jgi:hypothetical protein